MKYEYEHLRLGVPWSNPPRSPLMLIQETLEESRWARIVAAVMCCRTKREHSHPATWRLLSSWPCAESMARASLADVSAAIGPAGLQMTRASTLITMSDQWALGVRPENGRLIGVGPYIRDSDRIFMGERDVFPSDRELRGYLSWLRVRELVTEFLAQSEDDWASVNEDTGGALLCREAAVDLGEYLRSRGFDASQRFISPRDPYPPDVGPHWYVEVGIPGEAWMVDLTARQFDPELPFPYIWRAA